MTLTYVFSSEPYFLLPVVLLWTTVMILYHSDAGKETLYRIQLNQVWMKRCQLMVCISHLRHEWSIFWARQF